MDTPRETAGRALNRLGKWRVHFTGWQLGTRAKGDPEGDAVRDHREATLMLRAEVSTLTALLLRKGAFTEDEWLTEIGGQADLLCLDLQERWPGVRATDDGLVLDVAEIKTAGWMAGWKP
jgi:hypothetical protein